MSRTRTDRVKNIPKDAREDEVRAAKRRGRKAAKDDLRPLYC